MRDIWSGVTLVRPGIVATEYHGTTPGLFLLCIRNGILTVLTAGLYWPFAATQTRHYIISSIAANGEPLVHERPTAGTVVSGMVVFGLFAALVCFVNFGLWRAGTYSVFAAQQGGLTTAQYMWQQVRYLDLWDHRIQQLLAVNLLILLPLIGWSIYRRRQRTLCRIRWRGVRFGMRDGALGYAVLWPFLTLLAIASCGLLLPLRSFYLEKYLTDRTTFGRARLQQRGDWIMLYPALVPLLVGIGWVYIAYDLLDLFGWLERLVKTASLVLLAIGLVQYGTDTFRRLANEKRLGRRVRVHAEPMPGAIVGIILAGTIVCLLLCVPIVALVLVIGLGHLAIDWVPGGGLVISAVPFSVSELLWIFGPHGPLKWLGLVAALLCALIARAAWIALGHQQIISHLVTSVELKHSEELDALTGQVTESSESWSGKEPTVTPA